MKLFVKKLLTEANLSLSSLKDRPRRVAAIIEKIQTDSPFELNNGEQAVLDKSNLEKFQMLMQGGDFSQETILNIFGKNPMLLTADGKTIRITDLKKTEDLGGKSSTRFLEKEYAARGQLQQLIDSVLLQANTDSITINFIDSHGNKLLTARNVTGVDDQGKIGGVDPKADFVLICKGSNPVYISHKDGTKPNDFGQWGGVSQKAGIEISEHPEVVQFAQDLKNSQYVRQQDGRYFLNTNSTIGRKIKDTKLKLMAIFGNEFDKSGAGSPQNVDIVAQGIFKLSQNQEGTYNLTCAHMMGRQAFTDDFGTGYEPIIIVRYGGQRASHGINGARMLIYPISGRKVREFI